jgi:hypothetical protein
VLPLGTLFLCDLALNYYYAVPLLDLYTITKLGVFALLIWLGTVISRQASWAKLTGGGILGACIFYLATNFASWLYDPAYPKTLAGLVQALTIGTPGWPHTWEFFRNTLLSGGLFTGVFCGAMKLSESAEESKQEKEEQAEEENPKGEEAPA